MKIKELEKEIMKHNIAYWDSNKPLISDEDYDKLVSELKVKYPKSPILKSFGPTQTFGNPVKHNKPMLSLDKKYDAAGIKKWHRTFVGAAIVSPKMDGLAVSIHYDDKGRLYLAATRGDGIKGDDITDNVKTIKGIPHQLCQNGPIEIRGEIYMKLSNFSKHKKDYSNPRNLAAGAMRHKDPKKCAAVNLSFAAYGISGGWFSEEEKLLHIRSLGIPTVEFSFVALKEVEAACAEWVERRNDLDYEIDGIVFKADDCYEQDKLGSTSHHPRYAMAYKFQGDTGKSVLKDIEWSVSRTGIITPVAIIDPVNLSGAEITRVSLHNLSIMKELGLLESDYGCDVVVTRRGGVIPHIESIEVFNDVPCNKIYVRESCPCCGYIAIVIGDFLYCTNKTLTCKDQVVGKIEHFCKVIDIQGFGNKIIEKLYDNNYVTSVEDIYSLTEDVYITLPKVGSKLAKKLVKEVNSHTSMPLSTFLRSLGIHELGKHVSKILEEKYITLDKVLDVKEDELANIPTIGETIALSVVDGLYHNKDVIDGLLQFITITKPVKEKQSSDRLKDLSFLFTGKLLAFSRKDAQKMVQDQGGDTPSSITKGLNFLVVGDGSKAISSKQKKAQKFNDGESHIQIIDEHRFLEMIG